MLIGMREWMDECWVRWDAMVTVLFVTCDRVVCEGGVRGRQGTSRQGTSRAEPLCAEPLCAWHVVPRLVVVV